MSQQQQNTRQKKSRSIPRVLAEKTSVAGGTLLTGGVIDLMVHGGGGGMGVVALAAALLTLNSNDVVDVARSFAGIGETEKIVAAAQSFIDMPLTQHPDQRTFSKLKRLAGIATPPPTQPKEAQQDEDVTSMQQAEQEVELKRDVDIQIPLMQPKTAREGVILSDMPPLALPGQASSSISLDTPFRAAEEKEQAPAIPRLMPNDIIQHTELNSYRLCIGRSLTKPGSPAVWISFYKQHLKLIGASQYGKSSMAAAIIYLISRTHSPAQVLIAMLDLEHKTSKLFADLPHLAAANIAGNITTLHAKNREQVLEYLQIIVAVMDERYKLSEAEVEAEPILLVYLEEFLALKDYFKRLIDAKSGEEKEQAKRDYAQLVFAVSEIARRGLKVKVQLLMCAQVDYRDEDFQEALINIAAGMSFCVRVSAAQAAGFYNAELLKRNVLDDKKGQAVVETPDCKDLILAPEFNLAKRLLAFERTQQVHTPVQREPHRSMLTSISNLPTGDLDTYASLEESQPGPIQPPSHNPNARKLTYLHRCALEHYQPGIGYRPLGEMIGVGKDKAGDLLKDLRKWNFLQEEEDE